MALGGSSLLRVAVACGLVAGALLVTASAAQASTGTSRLASVPVLVGTAPYAVAVDQVTDTVYAANSCGNDRSCNSPGTVSVIDGATNAVTATIAVGSGPDAVAVDQATDTVYVANAGSGSVSVIDGATDTVTATITVGADPKGVAVDPITDTVWVTNSSSDSVSVISGVTNTVVGAIPVGSGPAGVAVDATAGLAYVANSASDTVSVIAMFGLGGLPDATVYGVGSDPTGVAVDQITHHVFVTSLLSATVSVIGTFGSSYFVYAHIPVGDEAYGVAVDQTTGTVDVTNISSNTLSVIDESYNVVTLTAPMGSGTGFGVAVDPSTGIVYTADGAVGTVSVFTVAPALSYSDSATITVGSPPPGTGGNQLAVDGATDTAYVDFGAVSNVVSVVDLATGTVTATIDNGSGPGGIAVDEATDTIYVANGGSNTVSVINGATNAVTATIAVGSDPYGIAVDEATDTVYVTDGGSNTVSVINGGNNAVTANIGVGSGPGGVAVDEATDTVYVTNSGSNTVSVINGGTNQVTATVGAGSGPEAAAVDDATDTVYVANFGSDTLSVINGATNAVSSMSVGYGVSGLALDQATDTVYLANNGHDTASAIDGVTGAVKASFGVGIYPVGTAVDANTDTAYVATSGETSGFGQQAQAPALSVITTNFATPPGAPTIGTATAGNGQASVAFGAPADDGGVAIGSYTVTASDLTDAARGGQTASGPTGPITVTGLTNGDSYTFTVTATSFALGAPSASSNVVTPFVPVPAMFTSVARWTFTKGVKGRFTPKATGIPAPTITESGVLPAGVKFTGGKLTGAPTVTGTFSITLTADNGIGTAATQAFTLRVLGFHISTLNLPTGTRGVAYSAQLKALGGTAPLTWKAKTALPTGLNLSSSGLVSGTVPTTVAAGTYTFRVRVSDSTLPTHQVARATVKITFS